MIGEKFHHEAWNQRCAEPTTVSAHLFPLLIDSAFILMYFLLEAYDVLSVVAKDG